MHLAVEIIASFSKWQFEFPEGQKIAIVSPLVRRVVPWQISKFNFFNKIPPKSKIYVINKNNSRQDHHFINSNKQEAKDKGTKEECLDQKEKSKAASESCSAANILSITLIISSSDTFSYILSIHCKALLMIDTFADRSIFISTPSFSFFFLTAMSNSASLPISSLYLSIAEMFVLPYRLLAISKMTDFQM